MHNDIVVLVFLVLCTYFDLRSKQIPVRLVTVFAFLVGLICFMERDFISWDYLIRILPGLFFLIISFITKQALGYGDGVIIVLIGLLADVQIMITFVLIALLISAVTSIFILLFKKGNRETKLPFMPFLLVAWCICLLGWYI